MKSEKIFVDFQIKVDETVRCSRVSSLKKIRTVTEVFKVKENYFLYSFYRSSKIGEQGQEIKQFTYSLRELTPEEYLEQKEKLLNLCTFPQKENRIEWTDEDNDNLTLVNYRNYLWRCSIMSQDCVFLTDNTLKKIVDKTVAKYTAYRQEVEARNEEECKEYARKCGILSRQYDIDFGNVLKLGTDEYRLICFKESYLRAIRQVKTFSPPKLRSLYMDLFNGGQIRRRQALKELEIEIFDALVGGLNLEELRDAINAGLQAYIEEFQDRILPKLLALDEEKRRYCYLTLRPGAHKARKDLLIELGLDMNSVIFRRLNVPRVLDALSQSLGIIRP